MCKLANQQLLLSYLYPLLIDKGALSRPTMLYCGKSDLKTTPTRDSGKYPRKGIRDNEEYMINNKAVNELRNEKLRTYKLEVRLRE